jgi:alpha-tubulin suppressor-like RCC1 family protein
VGTGRTVKQIAVGSGHTCALLDNEQVKCWGGGDGAFSRGELGYGDTRTRGYIAGQMGDNLPFVDFGAGRTVKAIAGGADNTCVLLDRGQVKCWGDNSIGEAGVEDLEDRGDEPGEMGDALPVVNLGAGRTAVAIYRSIARTMCAVLDNQTLKCWGRNYSGQLGTGDDINRGAQLDSMGDNLLPIPLGTGVKPMLLGALGNDNTCAVLTGGKLKCWGDGSKGQCGYGAEEARGWMPGQMGDNLPFVDLGTGRTVTAIAAGLYHTCVVLDNGGVKCFGTSRFGGPLGLGDTGDRGNAPGQMGDALPYVDLGP